MDTRTGELLEGDVLAKPEVARAADCTASEKQASQAA